MSHDISWDLGIRIRVTAVEVTDLVGKHSAISNIDGRLQSINGRSTGYGGIPDLILYAIPHTS